MAYNHKDKEIAVDSRNTCGSLIVSDKFNKIIECNGIKYVGCGDDDHVQALIMLLNNTMQRSEVDVNQAVLYWPHDGKAFKSGFNEDDGVWTQELQFNEAAGTGANFALAAMDFGCSAKEAVKYAMTRDIYSGGKVKVIKVK